MDCLECLHGIKAVRVDKITGSNMAGFNNYFKIFTGITPSRYRKSTKE